MDSRTQTYKYEPTTKAGSFAAALEEKPRASLHGWLKQRWKRAAYALRPWTSSGTVGLEVAECWRSTRLPVLKVRLYGPTFTVFVNYSDDDEGKTVPSVQLLCPRTSEPTYTDVRMLFLVANHGQRVIGEVERETNKPGAFDAWLDLVKHVQTERPTTFPQGFTRYAQDFFEARNARIRDENKPRGRVWQELDWHSGEPVGQPIRLLDEGRGETVLPPQRAVERKLICNVCGQPCDSTGNFTECSGRDNCPLRYYPE